MISASAFSTCPYRSAIFFKMLPFNTKGVMLAHQNVNYNFPGAGSHIHSRFF